MIAFDTNVFIYMLNDASAFNQTARTALRPVLDGKESGSVSSIVITEILAGLETADLSFMNHPNIQVLPVTASIATLAGTLRQAHRALRTVDAIHIASAMEAGCAQFITNDTALAKLPLEITVVLLSDYKESL